MVSDDNDALRSSIHRSLVGSSSSSCQAARIRVFWGVQLWWREGIDCLLHLISNDQQLSVVW